MRINQLPKIETPDEMLIQCVSEAELESVFNALNYVRDAIKRIYDPQVEQYVFYIEELGLETCGYYAIHLFMGHIRNSRWKVVGVMGETRYESFTISPKIYY